MATSPPSPPRRRFRVAVIGVVAVAVAVLVILSLTGHLSPLSSPFASPGSSPGGSAGGKSPASLPPASSLSREPSGWASGSNITPWQLNGHPVLFFEGATWCPYCAASSWVIYKVLLSFGGLSGVPLSYSTEDSIPEVVLAGINVSHGPVSFLVAEDTSGTIGQFPPITNSTELAYVTAYAGSSIPFVAVNGEYVHGAGVGSGSLINPTDIQSFTTQQMENATLLENGTAWRVISSQTFLVLAFVVVSLGTTVTSLATEYDWSSNLTSGVQSAVASL